LIDFDSLKKNDIESLSSWVFISSFMIFNLISKYTFSQIGIGLFLSLLFTPFLLILWLLLFIEGIVIFELIGAYPVTFCFEDLVAFYFIFHFETFPFS